MRLYRDGLLTVGFPIGEIVAKCVAREGNYEVVANIVIKKDFTVSCLVKIFCCELDKRTHDVFTTSFDWALKPIRTAIRDKARSIKNNHYRKSDKIKKERKQIAEYQQEKKREKNLLTYNILCKFLESFDKKEEKAIYDCCQRVWGV